MFVSCQTSAMVKETQKKRAQELRRDINIDISREMIRYHRKQIIIMGYEQP
jgi:hypothetical protein